METLLDTMQAAKTVPATAAAGPLLTRFSEEDKPTPVTMMEDTFIQKSEKEEDMTRYIRNKNSFRVAPQGTLDLYESLPPGQYLLKDSMSGFYLEKIEDFSIPEKLYGPAERDSERILETFKQRKSSTGVLLDGQKGGGKTMLARVVCVKAAERYNIPTIVITQGFSGDDFSEFIQSIKEPAIILFDEFEKVYDAGSQEKLLSLLDGVYTTRKLFILTSNYCNKINENLLNRPGRIFYHFQYKGIDQTFIQDYCEDALRYQEYTKEIQLISNLFNAFTFDLLQAIVQEVNRYKESPISLLKILNTKPDTEHYGSFYIEGVWLQDLPVSFASFNTTISINILEGFDFNIFLNVKSGFRTSTLRNTLEEHVIEYPNQSYDPRKISVSKIYNALKNGNLMFKPGVEELKAERDRLAKSFIVPTELTDKLKKTTKAKARDAIETEIEALRIEHMQKANLQTWTHTTEFRVTDIKNVDGYVITLQNQEGITMKVRSPYPAGTASSATAAVAAMHD